MSERFTLSFRQLVSAIDERARILGISGRQAAEQIGIPTSTLTRLRSDRAISVSSLLRILSWLRLFDLSLFVEREINSPNEDYIQLEFDVEQKDSSDVIHL